MRHSETFRNKYAPAYRVISNRFVKFLPLFAEIDKLLCKDFAVIAIEGGSASGKSTLAESLSEVYDCNLFHADDYFLRPEQRTPERFAEIGGNLDRERFAEEIVKSVKKGETVRYRRFDCSTQTLGEVIECPPKGLTVIEGVYSTHPAFSSYYDLSVFLDVDEECQKKRIQKRNSPEHAKRFFSEWIPLENRYFEATRIKSRADLIFKISE